MGISRSPLPWILLVVTLLPLAGSPLGPADAPGAPMFGTGPGGAAAFGTAHPFVAHSGARSLVQGPAAAAGFGLQGVFSLVNDSLFSANTTVFNGVSPTLLATSSDGSYLFVGSEARALAVLLVSSQSFVRWLPLENRSSGLTLDSANGWLFVSSADAHAVQIFNASSLALVGNVSVTGDPGAGTYDPASGEVFLAEPASDSLLVIDGSSGNVSGTIAVFGGPSDVVYAPGTDELFVTDSTTGNVTVVNASSGTAVTNISVGGHPFAATVDPAGTQLFVVGDASASPMYSFVSVINTTSLQTTQTVPLGSATNASGIAYDSASKRLYVDTLSVNGTAQTSVAVVDPQNGTLVKWLPAGAAPEGVIYNAPAQSLFVANSGSDNVTEISGTTGRVTASLTVGVLPTGVAVASGTGQIFVTDSPPVSTVAGRVFVVDARSYTPLARVSVGAGPLAAAYDASTNDVYVSDYASATLAIISAATDRLTQQYPLVGGNGGNGLPQGIAWDAANDSIAVVAPCSPPNSINCVQTPFDLLFYGTLYGGVVGSLAGLGVTYPALGIAYDPLNHDLYYASEARNSTAVIDGDNFTLSGWIPVGSAPQSVAVDPANGRVYVANRASGSVSVIDGSTQRVIGTISNVTGGGPPVGMAYDPVQDRILVAVGPATAPAHVVEIDPVSSTVVGQIPLARDNLSGITYDPDTGSDYVLDHDAGSIDILSGPPPQAYPLTFNASGLSPGTSWSVTVAGRAGSSNQSAIVFSEPNGSYYYTVGAVPGWVASPGSGYATVAGGPAVVNITFSPVAETFLVTFTESGLPQGTAWSVTLDGYLNISFSSSLTFSEPNGTFVYSVTPVPSYSANPSGGVVNVQGGPFNVTIVFSLTAPARYSVTFLEYGLPSGTSWTVNLNGTPYPTTAPSISIAKSNGTYPFVVSASGYDASPSRGNVSVAGNASTVTVSFSPVPPPNPRSPTGFLGLPGILGYALVGGVIAMGAAVLLLELRRRHPPPPPRVPAYPLPESEASRAEVIYGETAAADPDAPGPDPRHETLSARPPLQGPPRWGGSGRAAGVPLPSRTS